MGHVLEASDIRLKTKISLETGYRPPVCFRAGYSWFRYTERLNGPRAGRFFEKGIRISREPLGRYSPGGFLGTFGLRL